MRVLLGMSKHDDWPQIERDMREAAKRLFLSSDKPEQREKPKGWLRALLAWLKRRR